MHDLVAYFPTLPLEPILCYWKNFDSESCKENCFEWFPTTMSYAFGPKKIINKFICPKQLVLANEVTWLSKRLPGL